MTASAVASQIRAVQQAFQEKYGPGDAGEVVIASAPGRVNLIGEHTDYNDGFVLPIAIERQVVLAGAKRPDRQVRIWSLDFKQETKFNLDAIAFDNDMRWSNYLRGVFDTLQKAGYTLTGLDAVVTGNVPLGAGLSSSAALEVATLMLAQALAGLEIPGVEAARLCQRAENEFVGVNCGIMDQFISRLGRAGHALLIDCRSYEYRHIAWPARDVQLLVVDTRVERGLVDSEYNQRRKECEAGVRALAQWLPGVKALRDVSVEQFTAHADRLDPLVRSRCAHVIGENQRTLDAAVALEQADWERMGRLMNESHDSLRDLYQVSCRELDVVVEIARSVPGVYGARMTGAGFGGCAIALVRDAGEKLQAEMLERYPAATGRQPQLILTGAADGARIWPQ